MIKVLSKGKRENSKFPVSLHVILVKYNWFLNHNEPDTTTKETTLSLTVRELTP